MRRTVRGLAWTGALAGLLGVSCWLGTWVWWQQDPRARGTSVNGLWARHQWVGEAHTEADYAALARTIRANRITDVFFHAGPLEGDGSLPAARHAHARELIAAMRRLAPGVRVQAWLGQIRKVDGAGVLRLDDPGVRARIVGDDRVLLDAGFDGVHYDIEPLYPDDKAFIGLLDQTRALTRERGALLSVAVPKLTLLDPEQSILPTVLDWGSSGGGRHYPPRLTTGYLRSVAGRVDQVAVMTYDTSMPAQALAGRYFAQQTERVLRLAGDRVTVFMGVPTYRPATSWAEDLPVALRGVRKGLDALGRRPSRAYGVAVYADWTTSEAEWGVFRRGWPV